MNGPGRRRAAWLALAAGLAVLAWSPARAPVRAAGEAMTVGPRAGFDPEGTHVFRHVLREVGFTTPLRHFHDLDDDPARTLLVVLGDTRRLREVRQGRTRLGLEAFVRAGGAVLVATDQDVSDPEASANLEAVAGVTVVGRSRRAILAGPPDCYRGFEDCPIVRPLRGREPNLFRPAARDPGADLRVATNLPGELELRGERPPGVADLARFPPGSYYRWGEGLRALPARPPLFAVGGSHGDGQVLVLADHSVFINEMMLLKDSDNMDFAINCLQWLHNTPAVRDKVLFVEEGNVWSGEQDFNLPLRDVPLKPEDVLGALWSQRNPLLVEAEKRLARLEEEDRFNKLFFRGLEELGLSPRQAARFALLLSGLALLVYGGYRTGVRGRFRPEAAVPVLARVVAQHTPAAPLLAQRHQALLRAGNLWESAQVLARQFFAAAAIPAPPPAGSPPRLLVRGGWWRRRALRRRALHLWRLAFGPPVRVSPAALARLPRELDGLKAALADGSLRIGQ
jgi:hypothetical protein